MLSMKKIKLINLFLFVTIITGCIMYEEVYPEKIFVIKLNENCELGVNVGNSSLLFKKKNYNYYKVSLFRVNGGSTQLFGKIKLNKGGNGYTAKRIKIIKKGEIINSYGYNDLLFVDVEKLDSLVVYILTDE